MTETDKTKLRALRGRLIDAQKGLLLSAAEGNALPSSNEIRKIADLEGIIGAVEALLGNPD